VKLAESALTGLVLAGGRATRMGGQDKGLVPLAGRPMVAWVLDALRPQVDGIVINANRNLAAYGAFGYAVVEDRQGGFLGPLAGLATGLSVAPTPFVLTVPCDSPLLAGDLAARLLAACQAADAELAVAHDGGRLQPVFALYRRELADDLVGFLAEGGRKIDRWFQAHRVATVDFADRAECFLNVNDPAERASLEARLAGRDSAAPPPVK
jgi:molybdopterin-guanine dinucleotide biosynthesis protein A